MNRRYRRCYGSRMTDPRTSGDEPETGGVETVKTNRSPHERG